MPLSPTPLLIPAANSLVEPCSEVRTVQLEYLESRTVFRRQVNRKRRDIRDLRRKQKAADAITGLTRDVEIYGFTKGQFSLLQLLQAILDITGPVDFSLSTWTAAKHEIQALATLRDDGKLKSTRVLIDFSFARRDPEAANMIRTLFGLDKVRVAQSHSKFATFRNRSWKLVLRTSMNLNMNPRFEDFTLAHDPPLFAFIDGLLDEIWRKQKKELQRDASPLQRQFFNEEM